MEEERTFKPSEILEYCSKKWFDNPAGISALDLAEHLKITNEAAMRIFESFHELGKGSLRKNVKLYSAHFDPHNAQKKFDFEEKITHIFFPSQNVLAYFYEKLGLLRENIPEYKKRLKLGTGQLQQAYFEEEVLRRYFDHPEKYRTSDSESGGFVLAYGEETPYIYVRYSKRKTEDGKIVVGAIYKDLADMSDRDQNYWKSYELQEVKFLEYEKDDAYQRFVKSQFYGELVDCIDPIADVYSAMKEINAAFGFALFKNAENSLLKVPVENTIKSFCESCLELEKILSNGNIDGPLLKKWIIEKRLAEESDLFHKGGLPRAFSNKEMLKLIERKVCLKASFSDVVKENCDYRNMISHVSNLPEEDVVSYTHKFYNQCRKIADAGSKFAIAIKYHEYES